MLCLGCADSVTTDNVVMYCYYVIGWIFITSSVSYYTIDDNVITLLAAVTLSICAYYIIGCNRCTVTGVAQWLVHQSLAGGLFLTCARYMVNRW